MSNQNFAHHGLALSDFETTRPKSSTLRPDLIYVLKMYGAFCNFCQWSEIWHGMTVSCSPNDTQNPQLLCFLVYSLYKKALEGFITRKTLFLLAILSHPNFLILLSHVHNLIWCLIGVGWGQLKLSQNSQIITFQETAFM